MEQIGDRLRLEWRAPTRNRDGTTENLQLREARVLRRVLDLEALVKAQTHPAPPEPEAEPEAEPTSEEPSPIAGPEPPPAEKTPPEQPTPATGGAAPAEASQATVTQPASAERKTPSPPRKPEVVFPPFEAEAVVVATRTANAPGAQAFYEEPVDPSWIGKRVEYAVVYANRKKRVSPISTRVPIDPFPALAAPGAPTAEVGDGFVSLEWSPPVEGEDLGYLLFRRSETPPPSSGLSENSYPASPLNQEPLSEPKFEDPGIVFGVPLCYAVASVRLPPPPPSGGGDESKPETPETPQVLETSDESPSGDIVPVVPPIARPPRIQSPLSDEVCLTPEDHFPPPVPSGLVAVPSGDGILLTWRAVEARDLRGYRVYVGPSASGPWRLLGEVETPTYTDREVPPGEARFYAVTAIDTAPGTNESHESEAAAATRPQ